jgi:type I restriction enzyme S subunit
MALKRIKLGELIEPLNTKNMDLIYSVEDVKGISIKKEFIETKADMEGVSLKPYLIVEPDDFAYVTVTSRNGEKITIAHNDSDNTYIVSSSYNVFRVKRKDMLNSTYLFMYFNRTEFDRYSRFNSWGSAREVFTWQEMCDIEIKLPDLSTQEKFVKTYLSMIENQKAYEQGLEDLKLVCDGYIENLRRTSIKKSIQNYLYESIERNIGSNTPTLGVSIEKKFIESKRESTSYENYKIVKQNEFAFRPVLDKMNSLFTIALNDSTNCSVSPAYIVFGTKKDILLPKYLMLWLSRKETERWLAFNAWGSARNTIELSDLGNLEIPIPSLKIQESIVNIYNCYVERKTINEALKLQIKDICPILIKGSIEEAR